MSKHSIRNLYRDDHGSVISTELISITVVGLLGLIVTFTSVRDAAISELSDMAGSVQDVNQGYTFNSLVGHSSTTTGSDFVDATDHCDTPEDIAGAMDNCIVLTAPEDEEGEPSVPTTFLIEAEGADASTTTGGPYSDGWIVWSNGQIFADIDIPEDGDYTFSANLWGSQGGPDLPNAALLVDGVPIQDFDIPQTSHATAEQYSVTVTLTAGTHQFAVAFTNDFYQPPIDRNLFVDWLQVVGPN